MSTHSTSKPGRTKPDKPRPDFPLFPHLSGKWCKVIRGKSYYFGAWDDPEAALEEYLDVKDDLHAGRTPTSRGKVLDVATLCNAFLRHCKSKVQSGEMVERTYADYEATTDRLVRVFGKRQSVEGLRPKDFSKLRADIADGRSPVSVVNMITRTRTVFSFAKKNLLIENDAKFGTEFDRPSKKTLRQQKAKNGKRFFSSVECRRLMDNAQTPELKAMILLGLNCGFGNSDCAKLPLDVVDLERGWIDWARPKTGIPRRCPLWPETVEALKVVIERREKREAQWEKKNKGKPSPCLFVTKFGTTYEKDSSTVTNQFAKLLDATDLRKKGRGFYSLRHVFRTVADGTRDFPACRLIMGHTDDSMDAVYTESIDDERLQAVVDHVHGWLWPEEENHG